VIRSTRSTRAVPEPATRLRGGATPRHPPGMRPLAGLASLVVLLGVLGMAFALNRAGDPAPAYGGHHPTAAAGPTGAAGDPVTGAAAGFNATDVAWLQLVIPMHEQLAPLLDLMAQRGGDPALRELALRLRATHDDELVRLKRLRDLTGLPAANVHAGHRMPGLLTAEDLAAIGRAAGPELDRRLLAAVREHVDQCTLLAEGEQASGADPEARSLAASMFEARSGLLSDRFPG